MPTINNGNTRGRRKQVEFAAYLTTQQANVTGNGATATVIFDTEVYDLNSTYNVSTGVFTAPMDGVYMFTGHVTLENLSNAASSVTIALVTTTLTYEDVDTQAKTDTAQFGDSFAFTAVMSAGDTAKIQVTVAGMVGDTVDVQGLASSKVRTYWAGQRIG